MTKKETIQKYFNQKEKLTLKNPKYKHQVKWFTDFMLQEDLGETGDITSDTVLKNNPKVIAEIITKESGIIAGLEETKWLLTAYDLRFMAYKKDGDKIKKAQKILQIKGKIKTILKLERTILNILQRMSGIATNTNKIVRLTKNKVLIVPTRKTQWGLLDKKAVTLGGGGTHRLGLHDWILIKDNHISVMLSETERSGVKSKHPLLQSTKQGDPSTTFVRLQLTHSTQDDSVFYEIECKTEKQFAEFIKFNPGAIMLDNFKPNAIKNILAKYKKNIKNIILEASGGINETNISEYAKTGVDIISLGALTHSVKALDISLDIK